MEEKHTCYADKSAKHSFRCDEAILTKISILIVPWCYIYWNEASFQSRKELALWTLQGHPRSSELAWWKMINKLNQCLTEKWDHVMPQAAYVHGGLIRWRYLTCESYDSLSIISVLKQLAWRNLRHCCRKHGKSWVHLLWDFINGNIRKILLINMEIKGLHEIYMVIAELEIM